MIVTYQLQVVFYHYQRKMASQVQVYGALFFVEATVTSTTYLHML
jgi:hypothetical protein